MVTRQPTCPVCGGPVAAITGRRPSLSALLREVLAFGRSLLSGSAQAVYGSAVADTVDPQGRVCRFRRTRAAGRVVLVPIEVRQYLLDPHVRQLILDPAGWGRLADYLAEAGHPAAARVAAVQPQRQQPDRALWLLLEQCQAGAGRV